MTKLRNRRSKAALALSALLVGGVALTGAWAAEDDEQRMVTAFFDDAHPLIPGNTVRVAGVNVGTIESIRVQDGLAKVDMKLDESMRTIYQDASAEIVTENLLGERFIQLDKGTAKAGEMGESAVIPAARTGRVVDLQEVLNAVDTPTSKALAALVTTLGQGMSGQGKQAADAIKALEPAMTKADELAGVLRDQNELLGALIDNVTGPAKALAGERGRSLDKLVATSAETLSTVSANRTALEGTLQQLPSTIAAARRTLARVSGVADPTAETLASLRPITSDLNDISHELQRFADAADPALASLDPVLERGEQLLDEARPMVGDLKPAGKDLRSVASSTRTLTEQALSKRLPNLMEFVKGWSLATSDYDAISHYFKAIVPLSPKAAGQIAGGPVPGLEKPVPDVGVLPEPPDLPLPGRDEDGMQTLPPLLGGDNGDNDGHDGGDSGTGLSEKQEQSMLGQLLGGS